MVGGRGCCSSSKGGDGSAGAPGGPTRVVGAMTAPAESIHRRWGVRRLKGEPMRRERSCRGGALPSEMVGWPRAHCHATSQEARLQGRRH
eukprot:scaffold45696_cov27-Tisochrysis_lutea.AAC.6